MYSYRIYNQVIASDLEFPFLVPCEVPGVSSFKGQAKEFAPAPDLWIRAGEIPQEILDKEKEGIHWEFGSKLSWLANKTCIFCVEEGRQITYYFRPGKNPQYLRTYLLGFGLAMAAQQQGKLAMHCSALSKDGKAIMICGEPGAGKSTTAGQFLDHGWSLMADDMAWLEVDQEAGKVYVLPAFPYQKLCRDAALAKGYDLDKQIYIDEDKDKFLVKYEGEFSTDKVEIEALFFLGIHNSQQEAGMVERQMKGLDAFRVCAENLFLRHLLGQDKYAPAIGAVCLKIAGLVPMDYISRPDQGNTLAEMEERMLNFMK